MRGRRSTPRRRFDSASFDVHREVRYIIGHAQQGETRIVSLANLVFFSTATGDAWMLDAEDRLAQCLARDGEQQPFTAMELNSRVAIRWNAGFVIEGDLFVVIHRSGEVCTIAGYPTDEIAVHCQLISDGGPLRGPSNTEVVSVNGGDRDRDLENGERAAAISDQTTDPPDAPEMTTTRRKDLVSKHRT